MPGFNASNQDADILFIGGFMSFRKKQFFWCWDRRVLTSATVQPLHWGKRLMGVAVKMGADSLTRNGYN